jgi:hypothetical protein
MHIYLNFPDLLLGWFRWLDAFEEITGKIIVFGDIDLSKCRFIA